MYYKFYKLNAGTICSIQHNYLYASLPSKFNDPYEGYCKIAEQDELVKNGIPYHWEGISRYRTRRGVVCLSMPNNGAMPYDNILMWSHYASDHSGFCIEYSDCIDKILSKVVGNKLIKQGEVIYNEYPIVSATEDANDTKPIFHKAPCWEYEKEYRFVFNHPGCIPLGKDVKATINAIYLGVNCDINADSPEMSLLRDFIKENNICCYKMTLNPIQYKLEHHQLKL